MQKKVYIHAIANISPQPSFGVSPFAQKFKAHSDSRLTCQEPDYSKWIDAKMIRRMSRILKMGVTAASACMQEAGLASPDAVITATAYGCLQDTESFLAKMVEHGEKLLTPTAFIQSTHNTAAAQIALILHCHGYNNTFVHRGVSFESALLDSILLLRENEGQSVLVGALDEITDTSHAILSRFGLYKKQSKPGTDLFSQPSRGTIAGEGTAFFVISDHPSGQDYGCLETPLTFYKPANEKTIENQIRRMLAHYSLELADIDLFLTGRNGDSRGDRIYQTIGQSLFRDTPTLSYKQFCGEYPTSTAFALWMAAGMAKAGKIASITGWEDLAGKPAGHILIYNHHQQIHHSLLLVSAC
jgi:3-oxoacyl-[acyl-carrier-protein] synthase II